MHFVDTRRLGLVNWIMRLPDGGALIPQYANAQYSSFSTLPGRASGARR
jgi:hypothetical protein